MDEDVLHKIVERYRDKGINYVKLRGLVSRFMQLNPDGDPETIDWSAVYDDSLSYDELIEAFEREYPMYRWRETAPAEEKQIEEMVINHVIAQVEDLSEEALKSLINALEERLQAESPTPEQLQTPQEQATETPTPSTTPPEPQKPKVTLRLLASYPFLQEAREVVKGLGFEGQPEAVYKRARERIMEALERGELGVIPKLDNPWVELLSFPVVKAVVAMVDDDWLKRRWSLAEASRVERLLRQESDEVFSFILDRLLKADRAGEEYLIRFTDYLRLAEGLTTDISWKLVNQKVSKGWVYLSKTRLIRLIRQRLYRLLYDSFQQTPRLTKIPEKMAEIISEATEELQKIRQRQTKALKPSGRIPPCVKAISDRLADASHTENFIYASYLINRGYTVEQVIDAFRIRSDFKEDIARYQVEHIAGLRGSRTKYRPPSCSRMKELGLCIKNGELCPRNIRNPLDY